VGVREEEVKKKKKKMKREFQGQARDVRVKKVGVRSSPGGVPPLSYTQLLPSNTQTYKAGLIIICVGRGVLVFLLEFSIRMVYGRK
jgi:hypothetical protein